MRIHSISLKGDRERNEDVVVVHVNKSSKEILAGVFDGHGGSFVSSYLGNSLAKAFGNKHSDHEMKKTVLRVHRKLFSEFSDETKECGSTLLVCRLNPSTKLIQITHLGDTRAVVDTASSGAVQLTKDHKPETPEERLRITKKGERVEWDKEDQVFRVNGYSVSRSVGDWDAPGISQEAVVQNIKWTKNLKALIMGCDGLWDVMTPQQACESVARHRNTSSDTNSVCTSRTASNVAYQLALEAYNKGSSDNISVIVFLL